MEKILNILKWATPDCPAGAGMGGAIFGLVLVGAIFGLVVIFS